MNRINLYSIISSNEAETPEQGNLAYDKILPEVKKYLQKEEKFYVDFSNINNVTTAFINNSVGKLLVELETSKILKLMSFIGFSNNAQIKTVKHSLSNAIALSKIQ